MAVTLTVVDLYVTPFNLTLPNPYTVALGLYMAGWRGVGLVFEGTGLYQKFEGVACCISFKVRKFDIIDRRM